MDGPTYNNQDILSLFATEKTNGDYKLQIPRCCTTQSYGPLKLQTHNKQVATPTTDRHTVCSSLPPLPAFTGKSKSERRVNLLKRQSLTRFPVLLVRRPIEEAIDNLTTGLTLLELQDNVKHLKVS